MDEFSYTYTISQSNNNCKEIISYEIVSLSLIFKLT